ncbi:lamin-like protein [Cajanus cajan]|uniref:Lamin-like protein n=1 Tax=Cajanus cajan TaxID=3821 RepID=A0A151RCA2_CAJCA|nr:lamin-like protein [Cajanus cajan]KYP40294.1 Lamin-like protein [Cajanus cajan]
MEGMKRVLSPPMLLLFVAFTILVLLPEEASATKWTVGNNKFWNPNVNYTEWTKGKHFYLDDWLFFVYDRNQMSVLEVNKTDYESCNSDHPLVNWTRGAGRDVVPLNVTKTYYLISGKGFCFSGMKVAVHVEKLPPPPKASPIKSGAPTLYSRGHIFLMPLVFAVGAAWDAFIHFW